MNQDTVHRLARFAKDLNDRAAVIRAADGRKTASGEPADNGRGAGKLRVIDLAGSPVVASPSPSAAGQ